jgi:hypothetical protein
VSQHVHAEQKKCSGKKKQSDTTPMREKNKHDERVGRFLPCGKHRLGEQHGAQSRLHSPQHQTGFHQRRVLLQRQLLTYRSKVTIEKQGHLGSNAALPHLDRLSHTNQHTPSHALRSIEQGSNGSRKGNGFVPPHGNTGRVFSPPSPKLVVSRLREKLH